MVRRVRDARQDGWRTDRASPAPEHPPPRPHAPRMAPAHASGVPEIRRSARASLYLCSVITYSVLRMMRIGESSHTAVRDPEMIAPPLHPHRPRWRQGPNGNGPTRRHQRTGAPETTGARAEGCAADGPSGPPVPLVPLRDRSSRNRHPYASHAHTRSACFVVESSPPGVSHRGAETQGNAISFSLSPCLCVTHPRSWYSNGASGFGIISCRSEQAGLGIRRRLGPRLDQLRPVMRRAVDGGGDGVAHEQPVGRGAQQGREV